MPKKTIAKSAKTGQIVSKEFAKENPDTTFETEVKEPKKAKKVALAEFTFLPMVGERFDLNGDVAEVVTFEPLVVKIHTIVGGCQSEQLFELSALVDAKPLTKDEAFRRLAN